MKSRGHEKRVSFHCFIKRSVQNELPCKYQFKHMISYSMLVFKYKSYPHLNKPSPSIGDVHYRVQVFKGNAVVLGTPCISTIEIFLFYAEWHWFSNVTLMYKQYKIMNWIHSPCSTRRVTFWIHITNLFNPWIHKGFYLNPQEPVHVQIGSTLKRKKIKLSKRNNGNCDFKG